MKKRKAKIAPAENLLLTEHELQMLFDHIRHDNENGRRCFAYITLDDEGGIHICSGSPEFSEELREAGLTEGPTRIHTSKLGRIQ